MKLCEDKRILEYAKKKKSGFIIVLYGLSIVSPTHKIFHGQNLLSLHFVDGMNIKTGLSTKLEISLTIFESPILSPAG
jgi:hypothetical protein